MMNPGTSSLSREDLHKELIKQEIIKVKLEKKESFFGSSKTDT